MPPWLLPLSPVLGLAVDAAAQLLLLRAFPSRGLLRSEYAGFAAGLGAVAAVNGWALLAAPRTGLPDAAGHALLTLGGYAALGYCYFHFVNLGETARRIRLLRELDEGGPLTRGEILTRYGAEEIVSRRLRRLLSTGQVARREGRLFIGGPAVLLMARAMVGLKLLLLGKASEYER